MHRVIENDQSLQADALANTWETVLKWNLERAAARRGNLGSSMVLNALVYDEIALSLIHLPTQIELLGGLGIKTNRHKAAMRYGDFAPKLMDPKSVHVRYSDYMPEETLTSSVMTAQQVVDRWGNGARQIQEIIAGNPEHRDEPYVVADYMSLEDRVVWASMGNTESAILDGGITLLSVPNEWPFLNTVTVVGGTITEDKPEYQRKPLLFPVVKARMWLVSNIIGTLMTSQALAEGNEPTSLFQGIGAEDILLDLTEPGGRINLPTTLINYERLVRQDVDPGLRNMLDRYEGDISRATLPSVLVTAESLPGETFSGYNLRVQTAIGSLLPFKRVVEKGYEGAFNLMLLYSHYSGHDLTGYGEKSGAYTIRSEDIDPEAIVLGVELAPDVPIDRLQKISAAVMLSQQLNYSPRRVMEFLGETDPMGALKEYIQWQFYLAKMRGKVDRIAAEESGKIEQMAAQMAQEMIAKMGPPPTTPGATTLPPSPGGGDLLSTLGQGGGMDQLLNPDGGGLPAIEGMGDLATFEGATGETRGATREGAFQTLGQ